MKIYVPYAHAHYLDRPTGLNSQVERLLINRAEFVDVSASHNAYFDFLQGVWRREETFCIVEQDVLPTLDDLKEIEDCQHPWCVCPYPGPGVIFYESLGCTKFDTELMIRIPDLFDRVIRRLGTRHWYSGIDQGIAYVLKQSGIHPHHHGLVTHLHLYDGEG